MFVTVIQKVTMHDFPDVILPRRVVYRFSGARGNLPVLTVTSTGNLPVPVPVHMTGQF